MSAAEPLLACCIHRQTSDLKTAQIWGFGSCICLKQMRNAYRICMFLIAFVHLYSGRDRIVLLIFSQFTCPEIVSNVQHKSRWCKCDWMIKSLYCITDALALPSFALRSGNGMLRMGWNGLFTCAFISSEGKAKTFNKTFTIVQISVSLHPHFSPSVKLYKDTLHFPHTIYFVPPYTPYNYADNKGWSFGCPGEWGLLPVFWCLLVKKAFPPQMNKLIFLLDKILILFLGLLHFPFLGFL